MKTLAQIGYEAYGDDADWKSWDGRPMPRWSELRADIKRKWGMSAEAMRKELAVSPDILSAELAGETA